MPCREEVVSEEQMDECNDDEAFTERPAKIPGLGSPLHVIQPDDPTPPQSPRQQTESGEYDDVSVDISNLCRLEVDLRCTCKMQSES